MRSEVRTLSSMAKAADLNHTMRVIVLHGKDSFQLVERLKRLQRALDAHAGAPVARFDFDGGSASLADILDELRTYGLLASHKLIVVDRADQFLGVEERRRALERYAEDSAEGSTLVLRSETWRPGNLDKIIVAKGGAIVKCEPPDAATAAGWCVKRALHEHQAELLPAAADALVDRLGTNLARLDSELAKLAAFVAGSSKTSALPKIDAKIVAELVGRTREEQAWEIQSAVLRGSAGGAVAKVRDLVETSQAPEQLLIWSLVDLSRKLHDCARLFAQGEAENSVLRSVKLWGDGAGPTMKMARRLGPERAARLFAECVDLDRRSKQGQAGDVARTIEGFAALFADSVP